MASSIEELGIQTGPPFFLPLFCSESGAGRAARDQHAILQLKDLVTMATAAGGGAAGNDGTSVDLNNEWTPPERRLLDCIYELSTPAALLEVGGCVQDCST